MDDSFKKAVRADVLSVNDDPHDWYAPHKFHPESYVPETYESDRGGILLKDVEYSTIECPECGEDARKDDRGLPVCPECGVVCTSEKRPDHEVIYDAIAAKRTDTTDST